MTARAVVKDAFADGSAELELEGRTGCAGCHGACLWRLLPTVQRARLPVEGRLDPGASVLVRLPQRYVVLTSLLLYGVPLTGMLAGASLGFAAVGTDLGSLLGAACGIAASLGATPGLRRRLEAATADRIVVEPLR